MPVPEDLHVPEHILCQNYPVQLSRVGNHKHRSRIYEMVVKRYAGELPLQRFCNDLPPQSRTCQYIGLVDRMDRQGWVHRQRNLRGNSCDSLDLPNTVYHSIPRGILGSIPIRFRRVEFLPFTKVQATDELSYNDEIDSLGDFLLQRAVGDERIGSEGCRSNIGV